MYRVIIVDDEQIIRRGIKNSIDWKKHEMEVVGEAANGEDALALADKLQPDIVIADICMPMMDGLEMSEKLIKAHPDIRVIILTGYDEFDYAKRACKLGVADYLLKPTDSDDLLAVLEKVKNSIKTQKSSHIEIEELRRQLVKSMPLIRENYLIRLISGVQTSQDIFDRDILLNLQEEAGIFRIAVLDFDDLEEDSYFRGRFEMLHFAVKNICIETVDSENLGWTFYDALGRITVLFRMPHNDTKPVVELTDRIMKKINEVLKANFSIGVGKSYERARNIKRSYEEAKEALEYRFIMGNRSVLFFEDIQAGPLDTRWNELMKVEKEILSCISKGNEQAIVLLLKKFADIVKNQSKITPMWVKTKCYELVSSLYLAFSEMGIRNEGLEKKTDELYDEIQQSTSIDNAFALVGNFAREMLKVISQNRNNRTRKFIEMAKDYIQANYFKDISVADIAEHLRVTPNYFSTIFKKETGEGSVEYISRIRIENAKKLLKSSLYLTYEIAEMTGFKDANYFSLVFKKYTGMSPTEYRDSFMD